MLLRLCRARMLLVVLGPVALILARLCMQGLAFFRLAQPGLEDTEYCI